ncbi:CopG family transcriptional regulator [Hydrogenovibrio sp. JE_KL2]|uniref:CopG family transcriptional regulator n=1 Tax=Hydrogenovibrio sp. JE_KL2 TaxID=2651188 RepID=UPI00128E67D6|nr:CopG family transcriptional regulator [Hydrogenovibrio sp. JE_KL2]MPQ75506.1 CopG family transcriptional regulator [Hydrogenovibrio sp. JE_KL2]
MNYALRIPDYYKQEIEALKGDTSINQFIVNAIAEKISALKTEDYLKQRAERGSREHAISMLNRVADAPADKKDRL